MLLKKQPLMAGQAVFTYSSFEPQNSSVCWWLLFTSLLQARRGRPREVKTLVEGHRARQPVPETRFSSTAPSHLLCSEYTCSFFPTSLGLTQWDCSPGGWSVPQLSKQIPFSPFKPSAWHLIPQRRGCSTEEPVRGENTRQ